MKKLFSSDLHTRRSSRLFGVLVLLFLPLLTIFGAAAPVAQASPPELPQEQSTATYRPGEIVVKFKTDQTGFYPESFFSNAPYKSFAIRQYRPIEGMPGVISYIGDPNTDVRALAKQLAADSRVEYAEPNYIYKEQFKPNDGFYVQGRQYYLDRVNLPDAWDITSGSNGIVIAVVDSGIRNNLSDRLSSVGCTGANGSGYSTDRYGAYARAAEACSSPLRADKGGPAPPLPKQSDGTSVPDADPCYFPQPTPYPWQGTTSVTAGCTIPPLAGGLGVNDLKKRVAVQQGISTVPDCGYPAFAPQSPECTTDYNGHGTAVAGIISSNSNDGYGIAGVCWDCLMLPIRSLDYSGEGAATWVAQGIIYAADQNARVINLSLGGSENSQILRDAVRYAQNKGAILVAAAGNAGNSLPEYPAAYPGVIAVGATDEQDRPASFSSFGSYLSVAAPGVNILTTNVNWPGTEFGKGSPFVYFYPGQPEADRGDFVIASGTSFSAPIVSGVIGLMLTMRPDLSADQVKSILETTARDVDVSGRDDRTGWGIVNAGAAVKAARDAQYTVNRNSVVTGMVVGANLPDVVLTLEPGGIQRTLDPQGNYRFEGLAAGTYLLRALIPKAQRILGPVTVSLNGQPDNTVFVNFDFASNKVITGPGATLGTPQPTPPAPPPLNPASQYFNRVSPVASTPELSYFNETGHTLRGEFKRFWEAKGGLAIFGFPISEEFTEVSQTDGKPYTVQYFERNRFEFHPEFAGTPNMVLLGLLGTELNKERKFAPASPVPNTATQVYFPETQHTLSGRFYDYWKQNGGLAIFGYPISEPVQENGLLVQYFQRNRFEYHPENANSKYDVLLGLLGVDLARNRQYIR